MVILPLLCCPSTALGQLSSFGVLGGSTVTNTGATAVSGNLGLSPGSSVTGFPPGVVTSGSFHVGDAAAAQAQTDLTTFYNQLAGTACTANLTGLNLGGLTLTPGVYCFNTSAQLTGTLTLDALGDPLTSITLNTGAGVTGRVLARWCWSSGIAATVTSNLFRCSRNVATGAGWTCTIIGGVGIGSCQEAKSRLMVRGGDTNAGRVQFIGPGYVGA